MITDSVATTILNFSVGVFVVVLVMMVVCACIFNAPSIRLRCYICGRVKYWCEHSRRN